MTEQLQKPGARPVVGPAAVVLGLLLFLRLPSLLLPAAPQQTLRVEAETVAVNVLVTDRRGKPITGLQQGGFRVFEDDVEQEILNFFPVDAPFSVCLLLDSSYSTRGKMARIQEAAIGFLEEIHPDDAVMVISFDDDVYLETDFTRNKEKAQRGVKQTRTGQATQLYEAVYIGMEQLLDEPHRKVMVLFTDGVDSASPDTTSGETIDLAEETPVTIYTILFDTKDEALSRLQDPFPAPGPVPMPGPIPGRIPGVGVPTGPIPVPLPGPTPRRDPGGVDPREARREEVETQYRQARYYLSKLAEVSGGARFDVEGDVSDLGDAFERIAEEMRSLYTLGYISTNRESDGSFRKIRIELQDPDLRARARQGYLSRR